jgi:hypothetical protein
VGERHLQLAVVMAGALLAACGGGSGSGSPSAPRSPSSSTVNPCDAVVPVLASDAGAPRASGKGAPLDLHGRWRVLDDLWTHRAASARGGLVASPRAQAQDIGDIAVIQDEGDIVLPANRLDLAGRGLRFQRNAAGGYDVSSIAAAFREPLGSRLNLADDDGVEQEAGFAFPFFSQTFDRVFVNSDGNLTFGEVDKASTERNVARLLSGPPRVAPFLADLDPSAGGAVLVQADASALTVTYCKVPGFDVPELTTMQVTLLADGAIEMRYGETITLGDAVVGVSPGRTSSFTPVDLSLAAAVAGGAGAAGERFAARAQMDNVALARRFYTSHTDRFDQLVVWTDVSYVRDAFAYETTVKNGIRGLGIDLYDYAAEYGSGGELQSFVMMDALTKYPADPAQRFSGENTTLSLIGQETGHRWLVFLRFLDHDRRESTALLGRDEAHWSFFMDSDASVMEGNDIEDLGGGSFRTVTAVQRYSLLDQYAMGLVAESQVPPFFYVQSPTNVQPERQADSAPRVGVTFNGTRRDALIQDVVAVMGPRVPSAADAPRVHRQAFIYLVTAGRALDETQVAKVDRFRTAWEAFFRQATDGRMRVETTLREP